MFNMFKLLFYLLLPISFNNSFSQDFGAKNFGRTVSEAYIIKNKKDKIAIMTGRDKSSKGIEALRANDISNAIKIARAKARKLHDDKNQTETVNKFDSDTEYFVVARVADDVITNIDIINTIRFIFFSSGQTYNKKYAKMMINPILDALKEDKMRQRLARLQGMNLDKEVAKKLDEILKNNKMSMNELEQIFKKSGIDMVIFKRNIASKLVFSAFYQSVEETLTAQPDAIKKAKEKYLNDAKYERYKISEIFFKVSDFNKQQTVKENAEAIVELLNHGFNFQSLVDSVSQANTNNSGISEKEWIRVDNIDEAIRDTVKTLKPGEHSGVIQVPGGYKIVRVVDKALPNKEGLSKTKYKVVVAEIPTPIPTTQEEAISLQMSIDTIAEADSVEQFKRTCKVYNFKMMEATVIDPDPIQMELISRNKASGRSGIIRIAEDQPLVALFIVSEETPDVALPDDKTFSDIIISKQTMHEFTKMMKRQRMADYEVVYKDKLNKIIVD